jgi:hypothetical protein
MNVAHLISRTEKRTQLSVTQFSLQLFAMIKSEDGIKRRGDFFWSVVNFSFEKDTIEHIFTGNIKSINFCLRHHEKWP